MNTRPITAKPVDVLLGRGRGFYEWKGNIAYMQMISHYLPAYVAATKNKDKIRITVEILTLVKDSGGRFLGMDDRCGQPYEVSDAEARIKVSQALRHRRSCLARDNKNKKTGNLLSLADCKIPVVSKSSRQTAKSKSSKKGITRRNGGVGANRTSPGGDNRARPAENTTIGSRLAKSCPPPMDSQDVNRSLQNIDLDELSEFSLLELADDDLLF